MAIVTVNSDLLLTTPVGTRNNPANRTSAVLCACRFTVPALVAAADIASTFNICRLPANGRYLAGLSKVRTTAGGAGALLSVGHAQYRGQNNETVPANATFFGTGLNIAAAGVPFLDTLTGALDESDIWTDLVLTMTVAGANLPIGFAMSGSIVYSAAFIG